ncbi:hypothetical protein [Rhizobium sullae]|uniref:hypothetical protein n=1 Tax=Rhizobium sullae TaxID=50338 RepID=UPI001179A3E0|nr:hypothetical protein [Rhizobium sullae]
MKTTEMERAEDSSIMESLADAGLDDIARRPREPFAAIDPNGDKAKRDEALLALAAKLATCAERMGDEVADISFNLTGMGELSFRAYRRRANATPEKAS